VFVERAELRGNSRSDGQNATITTRARWLRCMHGFLVAHRDILVSSINLPVLSGAGSRP
jgi:hypothetical protein